MTQLTKEQMRAVSQIQILWATLNYVQRLEWVQYCRSWFDDDFVTTINILSNKTLWHIDHPINME